MPKDQSPTEVRLFSACSDVSAALSMMMKPAFEGASRTPARPSSPASEVSAVVASDVEVDRRR